MSLTVFIGFGNFVEALSELLVELHRVVFTETHSSAEPGALSPLLTNLLQNCSNLKTLRHSLKIYPIYKPCSKNIIPLFAIYENHIIESFVPKRLKCLQILLKQSLTGYFTRFSMEGKQQKEVCFSKKVSSYVKIAIICCTHSFYTQLTSSPCIHRKKKRIKTRKDKKELQKRFVLRNAAMRSRL